VDHIADVMLFNNGMRVKFTDDSNIEEVEWRCTLDTRAKIKDHLVSQLNMNLVLRIPDISVTPPGAKIKYNVGMYENFVEFNSIK